MDKHLRHHVDEVGKVRMSATVWLKGGVATRAPVCHVTYSVTS